MAKGINKIAKFGVFGLALYAALELGDCLGKAQMLHILRDPKDVSAAEMTKWLENPEEELDAHGYRAKKCKFIGELSKMM